MAGRFVDLHVHSVFSDGSMTPEEIVEAAVLNDVGLLAIADHNIVEGGIAARKLCEGHGIQYVNAVEIEALDRGENRHILGYGFDINDRGFKEFVGYMRFLLDEISIKLLELMRRDYPGFTFGDFDAFCYDRGLGGWKMLHYLMAKGLTSSLMEGVKFYSKYGMTYKESGFSTVAAVAYRIRQAGGYAVLAHPGETLNATDIGAFKEELRRIVNIGVDGIECYHPAHTQAVTQACLEVCGEGDLLVTGGSDCHGVFGKTLVGEMKVKRDMLRLKDLV